MLPEKRRGAPGGSGPSSEIIAAVNSDGSDHSLLIPVSQLVPRPVRPDELREIRAMFWRQASAGHRLPAEAEIILIEGGGHERAQRRIRADRGRDVRPSRTPSGLLWGKSDKVQRAPFQGRDRGYQDRYQDGVGDRGNPDDGAPGLLPLGYPSLSFLHGAAEGILEEDKPTFLYYIGNHDPAGIHIPQKVEADLREMAAGAEIYFERIAVNQDQIEKWNLPMRPTKKSDSRSKSFKGASVEADAIPPADLRALVEEAITQHIDKDVFNTTMVAEESERELLKAWAKQLEARP